MSGPRMKPWSSQEDRRFWAGLQAERILCAAEKTIASRCNGDAAELTAVGRDRDEAEGHLWHTIVGAVASAWEHPDERAALVARGTVE